MGFSHLIMTSDVFLSYTLYASWLATPDVDGIQFMEDLSVKRNEI